MKACFTLLFSFLLVVTASGQGKSFYDFTVETIDGEQFPLSQLKGKKVLVVNTASKCGLTPQYEELQKLYDEYGGEDFIIIGFPANNFREQEPGTNTEIKEFCTINYGVTFPMMAKIDVIGEETAPLYKWLTRKSENGKEDVEVTWNFQKFMINEDGSWAGSLPPRTSPLAEEIISWIQD